MAATQEDEMGMAAVDAELRRIFVSYCSFGEPENIEFLSATKFAKCATRLDSHAERMSVASLLHTAAARRWRQLCMLLAHA